jgi:phosphoenolpyruvate-protein phosphotransferase
MTAVIEGIAAAPGVVLGPIFVLETPSGADSTVPAAGRPAEESRRLVAALDEASSQLTELADRVEHDIGSDEGAIFRAQATFASDPVLRERAEELIEAGEAAEAAVAESFGSFRRQLAASENEHLAARVGDLDDVRDRVLRILVGGGEALELPDTPAVLVTFELTPSQTAGLPRDLVLGIATERGSATSHAAILARALGIPAVVGAPAVVEAALTATEAVVDGTTGRVSFDPDPRTRREIERTLVTAGERGRQLERLRTVRGATADGRRVHLAANLGSLEEVESAVAAGAEGCGLVRTEFLFQDRSSAPTVDEQVDAYSHILSAFPTDRVVFRTLDIGADKPVAFIARPREDNPALGVRGIRLGLVHPELLRDQLRAMVRAAREAPGQCAIMFPMVSHVREVESSLSILDDVAREERFPLVGIEVGVMIETPVAALIAGRLARHLQFVSIGTNDLLQYLYAVDRLQAELSDLPDLFEPAVLRLLAGTVRSVHEAGAWVGVCGEAAGTVSGASALVGLGCDELSMSASMIPEVKDALRRVRAVEVEETVRRAMAFDDAADARSAFEATMSSE